VELRRPWKEISTVALITQYPNSDSPIHVDGENDELTPGVALNIPVFNCKNCYSIMYKQIDDELPVFITTPGTERPYRTFEPSSVEQVGIVNYNDHAVLINTAKPHTIVNPTKLPRIVASFRFYPPILWTD